MIEAIPIVISYFMCVITQFSFSDTGSSHIICTGGFGQIAVTFVPNSVSCMAAVDSDKIGYTVCEHYGFGLLPE